MPELIREGLYIEPGARADDIRDYEDADGYLVLRHHYDDEGDWDQDDPGEYSFYAFCSTRKLADDLIDALEPPPIVLVKVTDHDHFVFVRGQCVYYEDRSDRDYYHRYLKAEHVAERLASAMNAAVQMRDYPYGGHVWTADDVEAWVEDPSVEPPPGGDEGGDDGDL